jgi:hypothetical protein
LTIGCFDGSERFTLYGLGLTYRGGGVGLLPFPSERKRGHDG